MEGPTPLVEALRGNAERFGSRLSLAAGAEKLSFLELWQRVGAVAAELRGAGVGQGERVLLSGPNCPAWVAAYFGIHAAGACAVPVDEEAAVDWVGQVVAACAPALVISDRADLAPHLPRLPLSGLLSRPGPRAEGETPQLEQPADILFTTGTTGRPKGVVLTHANLWHAALNISTFLGQTEQDVEVVPVPLSHSFGLGRVRCMALRGTALVLERGLKNPTAVLRALTAHQATGLSIVPSGLALLRRVAAKQVPPAARTLRYVELGSMALDAGVRDWALEALGGARLCHHYGLTEASRAAFVEVGSPAGRVGSIGRASPHVTITLRDERGAAVGPGVEGELCVRGGMVMREYLDQPELTRKVLINGELRTGDLAVQDESGLLFLRGRLTDLINVGGLKVAPDEVEQVLRAIEGVLDCACVGVPDAAGISGERVKAFYVAAQDLPTQALADAVRAKLEPHKVPAAFERVAQIPRTPSGKLLRRLLKAPPG